MRRATLGLLPVVTLAAFALAPGTAAAYGVSGVGGKVGFVDRENMEGTTSFDLHLELEDPGSRLHLLPSVGYWKRNRVSDTNAKV